MNLIKIGQITIKIGFSGTCVIVGILCLGIGTGLVATGLFSIFLGISTFCLSNLSTSDSSDKQTRDIATGVTVASGSLALVFLVFALIFESGWLWKLLE